MQKLFSRFALLLASAVSISAMSSCSDDDNSITPTPEPPTLNVSVTDIQRTQVDFSVQSSGAVDYAFIVKESDPAYMPTAQELFQEGTTGMMEDGQASISTLDVEGGKQFDLYVAVRKINPYVYSEVKKLDLNTDIAYTDIVTLDRIGKTDFKYHLEMPEGATTMKHVVIKKTDYEAIKSILSMFGGVTYETYLKVFGHTVNESTDIAHDKYAEYGFDEDIHIHTATDFLLMAGVPLESGDIDPDQFKCIEFQTRPAGVCPYDIQVAVETTSTSATISLKPDPGITDYRVLVDKKSEYDYWRREGEAQVRSVVIGHWDDETNDPKRVQTGDVVLKSTGLIPNTDYVIGIVGFDSERHECVKYIDFRTGEPVGPKPQISITANPDNVTAPWKSAAYNVKIKNAVSVVYGFFQKSQVDNLLANGAEMSAVIQNNGVPASADDVAGMLSAAGVTFENSELNPNTEYIFGVYAVNDEYVGVSNYVTFKTDKLPLLGGETRNNMPGHYTASTTDVNGKTVTFPVTITTGVNDATNVEYSDANRLVALGFGPADQFPYKSPGDLIAAGKTAEEAAQLYGPKWFIEFREDGIVVPKPEDLNWSMGNFGTDVNSYFWGIGIRPSNGRDIDNLYDFPVEVSSDGNTVTVKGHYNENISAYYYPSMCTASWSFMYTDVQFRCYSEIVMTRDTANSAYLHRGKLTMPKLVRIKAGDSSIKNSRRAATDTFNSK